MRLGGEPPADDDEERLLILGDLLRGLADPERVLLLLEREVLLLERPLWVVVDGLGVVPDVARVRVTNPVLDWVGFLAAVRADMWGPDTLREGTRFTS